MILYDYLDHPVASLGGADRFLIDAMRHWTEAARTRRCGCDRLTAAFGRRGLASVLADFGIAMMTLARDGRATLHLSHPGCPAVSEDEARLLALFAAARAGDPGTGAIAATLVDQDAVSRLVQAATYLGAALAMPAGEAR